MKETREDMWKYYELFGHYICITTNGTVNERGRAVMGRGNALQTNVKLNGLSKALGEYLHKFGNCAGFLSADYRDTIIIFPVKNMWWDNADTDLIKKSTKWLMDEAQSHPANIYHLPRPGCGSGNLDWETQVKPLVQNLPDNVFIHYCPELEGYHAPTPTIT